MPHSPLPRSSFRVAPIVLAICLALFAIKAIDSMRQQSATWDETFYFGKGKYLVQTGQWNWLFAVSHPPLSFYLNSIPFLFVHLTPEEWNAGRPPENDWKGDSYRWSAVFRDQTLLACPENDGNRLLFFSRLVMVLVGMLLGVFVYAWARRLYGDRGAITAIVLYSFCPNILAHTRLITPDICVTAFTFITMFYFWKVLAQGRLSDAVFGGIALGLALLSKYTGLLLVPICMALGALWLSRRRSLPWRGCLVMAAVGFLILLAGYRFDLGRYVAGLEFQQAHAGAGQWCFLSGNYSTRGWWYFFAEAFAIKTPLALLVLLAVAAVAWVKPQRGRSRFDVLFLLLPAGTVFVFFSLNTLCLGLRYILPVYPFLFVLAAGAGDILLSKRALAAAHGILLAWYVGASISIHPYYLAYFNELVGGPDNGYKYLVDSNLDWGQDLPGLATFMREHRIPKVSLSYFGSDLPERYGISYSWLPSFVLRNPAAGAARVELCDYVAISATNLQGLYFHDKDKYAFLRARKPVAQIGHSIFVYDLSM